MSSLIPNPEDSEFVHICHLLFEIANMEYQRRTKTFLCKGAKTSDFEYCFLNIDRNLRGLVNALAGLDIALSLMSRFPSNKYMKQYNYTEKGYALYHYSVICHRLSTIKDIYHKLVCQICNIRGASKLNGNVKWKELEQKLYTDQKYSKLIECLNAFYDQFNKYIKDRNHSSHEGIVYNSIFSNFFLTELWSTLGLNNDDPLHKQFMRGTDENEVLLHQSKKETVGWLVEIINEVKINMNDLFDILKPILLYNIREVLALNIKCWNSVPNKNDLSSYELFQEILKTQVREYYK